MLAAARLNKFLNVIPLAHATLVEQMRDGVLVVDNERRILEINRAATQIFGIEKREMIGKITTRLDHPGMRLLDNTLTGRTAHHEFPVGEGENTSWYEVRISAIRPNDDEIAGYMAIWHNITDRKLIERELRHTATHDILTGVYNRVFFEDAMHHNRYTFRWPVTVISLDLDNTKTTNDTLGHAAGDKLLSEMATLLRKTFRQDDLVARIGGDEFAVLAMQADNEAANLLLHRLAEAAAQYNAAAQHLPIQYSAGYAVAYYADELSAAFNKADDRMYAEKNIHKSQQ
jgi:diguanylate cyclase (GGDEF)-like protein/PAS domain S-box-containing protein